MESYPQSSGAQPFRPHVMGSSGPPQSFGPPMPMQFRPVVPAPQTPQFVPVPPQQFRPVNQGLPTANVGMPSGPAQVHQHSQVIQPLPPISVQPGQAPPSSQAIPMPYPPPIRLVPPGPLQPLQHPQELKPNVVGMGMPFSSSYTFAPNYGRPLNNMNPPSHYPPVSHIQASAAPTGGQPLSLPVSQVTPLVSSMAANSQPSTIQQVPDWQEHMSHDGKRYYYNKKTRQSSWEKPFELMTTIERADASTGWKEYTSAEGRKYYYNKVTKQSKWTMPEELKLAREQAEKAVIQPAKVEVAPMSLAPVAANVVSCDLSSTAATRCSPQTVSTAASEPVPNTNADSANLPVLMASGSSPVSAVPSSAVQSSSFLVTTSAADTSNIDTPVTSLPVSASASSVDVMDATIVTTTCHESSSHSSAANVLDGASTQVLEEAKGGVPVTGQINITPLEEKSVSEEIMVYDKQEAKNSFKALLESAKIESDWNWDQAMRVIINDKRYTALRTLSERKQAFNEYLGQKKKQEAEDRRLKQRKAREDFIRMLEECKELKISTRWSKAVAMFEGDARFNAVERTREREDLFESYMTELQKKEKAKAAEEHKQNILEYRAFLESCDFIKANSQWRKVQDRLEEDERCSRLEKIDRLKIFQDYVHDLEKEEEEQRKMQKEQLRREERKNRDEFRKLMEEHVAAGILTAKTQWRDYCMKVKDLPPFMAVSSNTSGATPKELFEDVAEELDKQYREDKSWIKDTLKMGKLVLTLSMSFEDFKTSNSDDDNFQKISEINLRLIFDELSERLREKEEKEAQKRQRVADNFLTRLHSIKEINASSRWEECKSFFEDTKEYKSIGEERLAREVFEDYSTHLKEKASDRERKRDEEKARKEKEREEKEKRRKERREREREQEKAKSKERSKKDDLENDDPVDVIDNNSFREERKREKDKDRKHRKRRHDSADDVSSEIDEKNESKKTDRRKSNKHSYTPESDSERRHRKQRKERDESGNGANEELEDGEVGRDGEAH